MNFSIQNFKLQNIALQGKNKKNKGSQTLNNEPLKPIFKSEGNKSYAGFSSMDILSNYSKASMNSGINTNFNYESNKTIPRGHSRYEYNNARLDIFNRDGEYRSQFVHPKDVSKDDFNKHFPYLEPIINTTYETGKNSVDSINGEIDEVSSQGSTGDCWIISALYSMASSEKGKEIIKDSITVNDDSSVTVTFGGLGISYTLTNEEISKHDTDNIEYDDYINGDNDILVMELAVEKLWKDINSGKVVLNTDNENLEYTGEDWGISDGGLPSQLVYYLTGIESNEYYNDDLSDLSKDEIYEILSNAYANKNSALSFGIYGNNHSATLTDGKIYEFDTQGDGHALAITDIQENTLTFINPWDTSTEYTMSWDEFASFGIGYISYANLDEAQIADEITDMTNKNNEEYNYSYDGTYMPDYNFNPGNFRPDNNYNPENFKPDGNFQPDDYSNRESYSYGNEFGISSIISFLESLISLLKSI